MHHNQGRPASMEMELPPRGGPGRGTPKYRRPWIWRVAVVVIIALIALIVPIAVVFSRRKGPSGPATTVLLPLYIHPQPGAWDPLYRALNSSSQQSFMVIVNPASGPGGADLPDGDYITNIQKLNTYSNVRTVGYVPTTYGTRNISAVLADITTYSGWATKEKGLAVHGIFFDEAPHKYTSEMADYLSKIDKAVKDAPGIQSKKTVIHNPGVPVDEGLLSNNTDITVACEETYETYQSKLSVLSDLPLDREHYSFVLHSVPSSVNMGDLIKSMTKKAMYLYATDLDVNYYESFGSTWNTFVNSLPS